MKCLFSKDSLQWFFSREGIKLDKSKLEKTEKNKHTKKCRKIKKFFEFSELFYQIIVHLMTLTEPLRELFEREVDFDWTGTCNKGFGKFCVNSDACLSFLEVSIYRVWFTPTPPHIGYLGNAKIKKYKIDKDYGKTVPFFHNHYP